MSFSDCGVSKMMQLSFIKSLGFNSNIDAFLTSLIAQPDCSYQVIVSDDFHLDCYLHDIPLKHNLFIYVVFLYPYENKKNTTFSLQYQLPSGVVPEIPQESFDWGSQGFSQEYNQGDMFEERLGTYQFVNPARPSSRFSFCFSDIQPNVRCESFERGNSSKGCEGASVRQEVLESELLCRNSRNSYRADYSEIYPGARNEVKC